MTLQNLLKCTLITLSLVSQNAHAESRITLGGDYENFEYAPLGTGFDDERELGRECLVGDVVETKFDEPRLEIFLVRSNDSRWPKYVYGARILVGERNLVNPSVNPKWLQVTRNSEELLARYCGSRFLAREEIGIMITKNVEVSAFEGPGPREERFSSLEELAERLKQIQNVTGPIFHVGYKDSPNHLLSKEQPSLVEFLKLVKRPELRQEILSSKGRVGVETKALSAE